MKNEKLWDIPLNWEWTEIKALGDVVAGGTPSTKEPRYWGNEVNWISPADLTGYSSKTISCGAKSLSKLGLDNSSAKVMPSGSVHFSTRAPIGYVAISAEPLATNQGFKSLIPSGGIFNEYVYYYLKGSKLLAEKRASGTTFLELSGAAFGLLPIPLPPTPEQHRIVAKIEELFSALDKGVENLKTAREQLKVYRQAVLKHAFEGKLTGQWREENRDKLESAHQLLARIRQEREIRYEQQLEEWKTAVKDWEAKGKPDKKPAKPRKPAKPDKPRADQVEIMWDGPPNWQWLQLGDFCFVTKLAGFEYTKFVRYDDDGDLPVIKAENAGPNGFRRTEYSHVHSSSVKNLTRSYLGGGELLMVFVGAGTGNVATVPSDRTYFLGPNIGMMRLESDAINPRYVELFLRSPKGKQLALASVKAVAQPSLSMGTIRQIPVILPSTEEQDEIVNAIEDTLSLLDKQEQDIEYQLLKAESLRQSILKKAFSGQLVRQDTNDESASVLLERIKVEKAEHAKKNKKRKKEAA
ncbi:restriction endonuclease subunit S [Nisaea sp.]|uniref:restriction endonuclease subunit S n=1 Tax=Nisaea sp. TaxID=2024842 RepID=UPI0025D02DF9|nr:restriction endonuclease subunit S [Nisaea sp.]